MLIGQVIACLRSRRAQPSGGTTISVGANKWMKIRNKHLSTRYNSNLADTVTAQTATITGMLHITGGDIVICDRSTPHHYGTLYVSGDVVFKGGTYRPVVDVSLSGHCDVWKSVLPL